MRAPTEEEIRTEVYMMTMEESGEDVEKFIQGALWLAGKWSDELKEPTDE